MKTRVILPPNEIPTHWLNILPDLPEKCPPLLFPQTLLPAPFEVVSRIFPEACVMQEVSEEPFIEIPHELRETFALMQRPTPLQRAVNFERAIGLEEEDGIKIYYKREDVSPAGSHKLNTALAQAYYAKQQGFKTLITETGAGQWGSALSLGCCQVGLGCTVYMARGSYLQKPGRRILMELYGSTVFASPSPETEVGQSFLDKDPDHPGSLGIAISEALEHVMRNDEYRYALGSVVNFVLLHQTIIGQEALAQMNLLGEYPDVVIGCAGGGSNFYGCAAPFIKAKLLNEHPETDIIAVESTAAPKMTKGVYAWDFGDSKGLGPVAKMMTIGHDFVPSPIHAGGLRYHGMAPIVSILLKNGVIRSTMLFQLEAIEAGAQWTRTEGIVPAPETSHAICEAKKQALTAKQNGEKKIILLNHSGHGFFDLSAYQEYLAGTLENYEYPAEAIAESENNLPAVDESLF